jgi:hypothetical protein
VQPRILVGTLALATLAACGGGGASDDQTVAEGSVQEPAKATTTTAPARVFTAEELKAALITVSDLPSGYSISPEDEEATEEDDDSYCDDMDPSKTVPASVEAEASFQKEMFGPFVGSGVAQYASADEAKRFMAEARKVFDVCASYDQTDEDGTTSHITVREMSFPKKGDDSFAMKLTATGTFPFVGDMVWARDGSLVYAVSQAGIGSIDHDLTSRLADKAEDKVEALK